MATIKKSLMYVLYTCIQSKTSAYLYGVGDFTGIVKNGELRILELHGRRTIMRVVLVLTLKLLV